MNKKREIFFSGEEIRESVGIPAEGLDENEEASEEQVRDATEYITNSLESELSSDEEVKGKIFCEHGLTFLVDKKKSPTVNRKKWGRWMEENFWSELKNG